MPLFLVRSMEQIASESEAVALRRQMLTLLAIFGAAALVVATLGLYGVLAQLVAQRRREIGVRLALGASRADVVRLILARGFTPTVAGLLVGLSLSVIGSSLGRKLLFEVSPADPLSLAAVCALLATVAVVACLVPTWRALRVDPIAALKSE